MCNYKKVSKKLIARESIDEENVARPCVWVMNFLGEAMVVSYSSLMRLLIVCETAQRGIGYVLCYVSSIKENTIRYN